MFWQLPKEINQLPIGYLAVVSDSMLLLFITVILETIQTGSDDGLKRTYGPAITQRNEYGGEK